MASPDGWRSTLMIKRQAIQHLETWLYMSHRKPLVIRGARQVGKTWLVRKFAETCGRSIVEINLEEITIEGFERPDSFSLERTLAEIRVHTGKPIDENSILFIDEIQASTFAYERLRFFYEKMPELPVVAAGSLLEVELRDRPITAPVGRIEFFFLGPMTFGEFLVATGESSLWEAARSFGAKGESRALPKSIFEKLVDSLRDFYFVGGMPEAVARFVEGQKDYMAARESQQSILETYRQDIRKYSKGKLATTVLDCYDSVVHSVGEKTKYTSLSNSGSSYVAEALRLLSDIFVIQKVTHSNGTGVPLSKVEDKGVFKLFLLDVGIYNCLMGLEFTDIVAMDTTTLLNKGVMAEQFVAQHLYLAAGRTASNNLHYWLRDKKVDNAEIDFLLARNQHVLPIEVKAGKSGTIKSLHQFMRRNPESPFAIRLDLNLRDDWVEEVVHRGEGADYKLASIPLYLIESIDAVLDSLKEELWPMTKV